MSPRIPTSDRPRSGGLRGAGDRLLGRHRDNDAVAEREARFVRDDEARYSHDPDDGYLHDGVGTTHRRGAAMGATAITAGTGGRRRRRRGGLLWPLLALLALGALVLGGLALFGGGDDDGASKARDDRSQPPAQSQNGPAAVKPGALGIDGKGIATGASLAPFVGKQVDAKGMEVVQVDENAGFFVGGGKGERTFVEWGGRAGGDEATSMPKVGDRVDIKGPVAEPPKQPGRTFGVPVASERVILKQGGYVNADEVTPSR